MKSLGILLFSAYFSGQVASACPPISLPLPDFNTTSRNLPNPFTFLSGQKVLSKADWLCRRIEMSALVQEYGLGILPHKPPILNATLEGSKLKISLRQNAKETSFSVQINLPSSVNTNTTSYPAIISLDNTLPINTTTHPIATITYNPADMADPNTRGRGKFYDIHGPTHASGAFTAWTWGLSLIIDALELLGPETTQIDTTHLGLTGCSRHGKAVLAMGALEPRIALTIPREAGVGGAAPWRLWDEYKCRSYCTTEPARPWVESPWWKRDFANFAPRFRSLPWDQHFLVALIAPRGLLVLENDIDFLKPESSVVGAKAGRMVFEALGAKRNMGVVVTGSHAHCRLAGAEEGKYLHMYLEEFLLGKEGKVGEEGVFDSKIKGDVERWVDWRAPVLGEGR